MASDEYYGEVLDSVPFKITVGMFERMMPTPMAYLLAVYFRIRHYLRLSAKPRHAFGPVGSARIVTADQMPPRPMSRWAAKLETLKDLGFQVVSFGLPDLIGAKEGASVLLLDQPGTTFACIEWQRLESGGGEVTDLATVEFDSFCTDDPEVMTALVPQEHLAMADAFSIEFVDSLYLAEDNKLSDVYADHRKRFEARQPSHFTIEQAQTAFQERNLRRFEFVQKLGLVRRLKPKEVTYVRQQRLPS